MTRTVYHTDRPLTPEEWLESYAGWDPFESDFERPTLYYHELEVTQISNVIEGAQSTLRKALGLAAPEVTRVAVTAYRRPDILEDTALDHIEEHAFDPASFHYWQLRGNAELLDRVAKEMHAPSSDHLSEYHAPILSAAAIANGLLALEYVMVEDDTDHLVFFEQYYAAAAGLYHWSQQEFRSTAAKSGGEKTQDRFRTAIEVAELIAAKEWAKDRMKPKAHVARIVIQTIGEHLDLHRLKKPPSEDTVIGWISDVDPLGQRRRGRPAKKYLSGS